MKKFFKKKEQGRRASLPPRQSAPIARYYRPANATAAKTRKKDKTNLQNQKDSDRITIKRASNIFIKWFGLFALGFVILINTTLSSTTVRIKSFDSETTKSYRSKEAYNQQINQIFSSSFLYKSKFSVNTEKFEARIKEAFPEVEQASVVIPLAGRKLQVSLRLVDPLVRLNTGGNQEALLSKGGVVLQVESQEKINSSFASLPLLSLPNITISQGAQLLTSDEATLVGLLVSEFDGSTEFRKKLKSIEFDVQKREIRARFDGLSLYAKLTPERDARLQVGSLAATIEQLAGEGKLPQEYIDVRIDDRVFIK